MQPRAFFGYHSGAGGVTAQRATTLAAGGRFGGGYDYLGDLYSYATGLSKDSPNFTKSYVVGTVSGLMYPLAISEAAISQAGTFGKIVGNGYNAAVAGTAAFGAAGMTNQSDPALSGGSAGGLAATGAWAKTALPGSLGAFANQLIQGIAGPLQTYIQNNQAKSGK